MSELPVESGYEIDGSGVKSHSRRDWILACATCYTLLAVAMWTPQFRDDEGVYLVGMSVLSDNPVLREDFTWQGWQYHAMFNLIASPLSTVEPPIVRALLGRAIVWIGVIYCSARLAQSLGVEAWSFAIGFCLWVYAKQSIVAKEWIVGGVEAKTLSYTCVLVSLEFLVRWRPRVSAFFAGLAASLHPSVGAWCALGGLAALAWCYVRRHRTFVVREFVVAVVLFVCGSVPGFIPSVVHAFRSSSLTQSAGIEMVSVRNPDRLDPAFFLTPFAASHCVLVAIAGVAAGFLTFRRRDAETIVAFLVGLLLLFLSGIPARHFEMFSYLNMNPFRVWPVFALFFFFLAAVKLIVERIASGGLREWNGVRKAVFLGVSWVVLLEMSIHNMPSRPLGDAKRFITAWQHGSDDGFGRMANWIRENTPVDTVFIAPPWEARFWLLAERRHVVTIKLVAVGRFEEWHERLVDLLGEGGYKHASATPAGTKHYHELSTARLSELCQKYGASHYLTTNPRPDLHAKLIHSEDDYWLYRIDTVPMTRPADRSQEQ